MDIMDVAALKAEICRVIAEHELHSIAKSIGRAKILPSVWKEFGRRFREHLQIELAGSASWFPLDLKTEEELQAWLEGDQYESLLRKTVSRVLKDLVHQGGPTLDDFIAADDQ